MSASNDTVSVLRCDWDHVTLWPSRLHPSPDECPALPRTEGRVDFICGRELRRTRTLYAVPHSGREVQS